MMRAWTDYPIVELGDREGEPAPIRSCEVTEYDRDKYATVVVGGITTSFKAGYLYSACGRYGEVPQVKHRKLKKLPLRGLCDTARHAATPNSAKTGEER